MNSGVSIGAITFGDSGFYAVSCSKHENRPNWCKENDVPGEHIHLDDVTLELLGRLLNSSGIGTSSVE